MKSALQRAYLQDITDFRNLRPSGGLADCAGLCDVSREPQGWGDTAVEEMSGRKKGRSWLSPHLCLRPQKLNEETEVD